MSVTTSAQQARASCSVWTRVAWTVILLGCQPAVGAAGKPPDVVLVTLDTTRADRLGCYGDATARTPTLDALAAGGVRFARALTSAPLTLPAHASLMTGLEPPRHGLHDNGLAALPAELPTLAEALAAQGYATGAVVASGVLDHRFGLDRGFDEYNDRLTAEQRGEYGYPERDAEAVTDAALAWAGAQSTEQPYFLWVHYYDPHAPYLAHDTADTSTDSRYAAEIRYVDRHLGRLLGKLPGDPSRRVVAVVGDHGEMLGEHGERAHGLLLYRASLEVPLIVSGPGVTAGQVVDTTVASSRLAASLARLAGLESGGTFGRALPGLPGSASPPRSAPVYSETWLPATAYGWSRMLAVSVGRWRYVQAPRAELFDFVADPSESRNLLEQEPERGAELLAELGRFAEAEGTRAEPAEGTAELQAQLRALGYMSGMSGDAADASAGDGIDPKDGVALLTEFEEAKRLMSAGDPWGARTRFDDLVRRNPSNVPFLMRAADARLATGDTTNGLALIRKAIELNPRLDLSHQKLAEVLLQIGDAVGADAAFAAALELNPRLAGAWLGRAQLAAMAGRGAEESALLGQAVAEGTLSGAIFARLGQLALADGELVIADARLKQATDLVGHLTPAWWNWGQVAERQGDLPLAVERYGRAIELSPRDASARLYQGRLLVQLGRRDEARRMLQVAAQLGGGSEVGREAARLLAAGVDGGPGAR